MGYIAVARRNGRLGKRAPPRRVKPEPASPPPARDSYRKVIDHLRKTLPGWDARVERLRSLGISMVTAEECAVLEALEEEWSS